MVDIGHLIENLFELIKHEQLWKPLAVVIATVGVVAYMVGRRFPAASLQSPRNSAADTPALESKIELLKKELSGALSRFDDARRAVAAEGPGLWLSIPPAPPKDYELRLKSSIPILVVANLKGGVGKTTIATGLAAHFANPFKVPHRKSERVLLIDLDFQGSLSSMALTTEDRSPGERTISRATQLISGDASPLELLRMHQRVKGLEELHREGTEFFAIPSYYDLAQAENRLMVEWLIGDAKADIRYNLARILLSEEVQRRYDRIVMDAPPRLTTAHVQALTAATHVLIPTVLDQLSGEAVGSFVEQLIIHARLWPHLKVVGVVGSMTEYGQDKRLLDYENDGLLSIRQALEQKKDAHGLRGPVTTILPRSCFIPDVRELGRAAGSRIGYLNPKSEADLIRRIFDHLGVEVTKASGEAQELRDLVRP